MGWYWDTPGFQWTFFMRTWISSQDSYDTPSDSWVFNHRKVTPMKISPKVGTCRRGHETLRIWTFPQKMTLFMRKTVTLSLRVFHWKQWCFQNLFKNFFLTSDSVTRKKWGIKLRLTWLNHHEMGNIYMAVCQNLVPLVNIKIAGKWMFIPLKMVLIGIDPYPYISAQLFASRQTGRWSWVFTFRWLTDVL